jgi:deoxyribonuclease V
VEIPRPPHAWKITPRRAAEVQRRLAGRVRSEAPVAPLRRVAGVDCAYAEARWMQPAPIGSDCIAAAVVWDVASGEEVERRIARRPVGFPYIPGLLSFRELPAVLAALRALRTPVDALLADGHGIAHPRRFGIGSHLGVLCDLPCVGVAKSVLIGTYTEPGTKRGARRALRDGPERIGTALRTRDATKPVFVSIGHRIDLASAERLVLACGAGRRLPEPTRLADRAVGEEKRAGNA